MRWPNYPGRFRNDLPKGGRIDTDSQPVWRIGTESQHVVEKCGESVPIRHTCCQSVPIFAQNGLLATHKNKNIEIFSSVSLWLALLFSGKYGLALG